MIKQTVCFTNPLFIQLFPLFKTIKPVKEPEPHALQWIWHTDQAFDATAPLDFDLFSVF